MDQIIGALIRPAIWHRLHQPPRSRGYQCLRLLYELQQINGWFTLTPTTFRLRINFSETAKLCVMEPSRNWLVWLVFGERFLGYCSLSLSFAFLHPFFLLILGTRGQEYHSGRNGGTNQPRPEHKSWLWRSIEFMCRFNILIDYHLAIFIRVAK